MPVRILMLLALLGVAVAGVHLRLTGTGWDSHAGLNPDERNNTTAMRHSFTALQERPAAGLWFDTDRSPLNPRVGGGRGIVYGDLPHLLGLGAVLLTGAEAWPEQRRVVRLVSAVADSLTILAVLLAGLLAFPRGRALLAAAVAAALYAWVPLAIQYAGFFVVDTVMTLAGALMLLLLLAAVRWGRLWLVAAAGLPAGAALACKISMVAVLPLIPFAAFLACRGRGWRAALAGLAGLLASGLAFRVLSPSLFAGPGLSDLAFSPVWLGDLAQLAEQMSGAEQPPHRWLWIGRTPFLYPLSELALWAIGPGLMLAGAVGLVVAVWRGPRAPALLLAGMVALVAAYAGRSEVSPLRYWLPLLPAWCVLAVWPLAMLNRPRWAMPGLAVALVLTIGWGQALAGIHRKTHTRIEASGWLRQIARPGMTITNETWWDEALPWPEAAQPRPATSGQAGFAVLMITDADDEAKRRRIAATLARTDLLVVSSRRQVQAMTRLPRRFPLTTRYYRALFDGSLCFAPVARFRRPFRVFGIEIDDGDAQESWTAYDHPEVRIFARQPCYSEDRAYRILGGG